jgi:hypothetical protein
MIQVRITYQNIDAASARLWMSRGQLTCLSHTPESTTRRTWVFFKVIALNQMYFRVLGLVKDPSDVAEQ